jgi:hypothetical protein
MQQHFKKAAAFAAMKKARDGQRLTAITTLCDL